RHAGLRNGLAAPFARLASASVDLELVLHRARAPVGERVVPEGGSLACDARLERGAHGLVQPPELPGLEALGSAERMDPRAPERLVHVDISQARERALVEEHRLDRRAPPCKALSEPRRGEERVERLLADAGVVVRLELARLDHEPVAYAPLVAVGDVRAVIYSD